MATELAKKADQHPECFAELARDYSEDESTRFLGGSLGGVRASDLMFEPEVLDALAALRPGEVSRVVETQHGFQILIRRAAPPEAWVSGTHIVIGHEGVHWLQSVGAVAQRRSHAEASELAARIYRQALANPRGFESLIAQYSEHPDKAVAGDIGTWSVREPTHHSKAIEVLRGLSEGEVSPPIESHYGFEILQRTAARPRERYAMEAIKLRFAPGDEASKQFSLGLATDLSRVLRAEPWRFDEFRAKYCCPAAEAWWEGRDQPGLSALVSTLSIGQVAPDPVLQYVNVIIPRRADPQAVPLSPPPSFDVPAPVRPDLDWLSKIARPLVEKELLAAASEGVNGLRITAEERRRLESIVREFAAGGGATHGESSIGRVLLSLEGLLGLEKSSAYRARFEQRLVERFLDPKTALRQVEL